LAFRIYDEPTLKFYFLTGVSLGILVGTKYFGGVILISILILHYYRILKNKKNKLPNIFKASCSKNLWILFLSVGVTFLLTTPCILLRPMDFISSQSYEITLASGMRHQLILGFSVFLSLIKNFVRATDFFEYYYVFWLDISFPKALGQRYSSTFSFNSYFYMFWGSNKSTFNCSSTINKHTRSKCSLSLIRTTPLSIKTCLGFSLNPMNYFRYGL
jgi:hypothetical protein